MLKTRAELEHTLEDPDIPMQERQDAAEALLAGFWAETWANENDEEAA